MTKLNINQIIKMGEEGKKLQERALLLETIYHAEKKSIYGRIQEIESQANNEMNFAEFKSEWENCKSKPIILKGRPTVIMEGGNPFRPFTVEEGPARGDLLEVLKKGDSEVHKAITAAPTLIMEFFNDDPLKERDKQKQIFIRDILVFRVVDHIEIPED